MLNESKPLACFLLSLANHDPLISQMALDMLKRLGAHEIIVEILLEQGKIIDAIRLSRLYSNTDYIPARKYLESALKSDDKMVFFSVFNFMIERNQRLRGNCEFMKSKSRVSIDKPLNKIFLFTTDEQCDTYVRAYNEMFPSSVN